MSGKLHPSNTEMKMFGFARLMILMAVYTPVALAVVLFSPIHFIRLLLEKYSIR